VYKQTGTSLPEGAMIDPTITLKQRASSWPLSLSLLIDRFLEQVEKLRQLYFVLETDNRPKLRSDTLALDRDMNKGRRTIFAGES
jgi:hypothetical protein